MRLFPAQLEQVRLEGERRQGIIFRESESRSENAVHAELAGRLQEILDVNLADDVLAWRLHSDGTWTRIPTVDGASSHARFHQLAQRRAVAESTDGQQP